MKTLGDEILKLIDEMDIEEANVVEVSRTYLNNCQSVQTL